MLNYTSDESSQSSHFIINTETENIILLSFNKLNEEDLFFNNDFLQDNILEMTIAKVATNNDCFCKELALTVKHIFDFILEKEHNKIIYASLPYNCLKHQLIMRYIKDDENDHFKVFSFVILSMYIKSFLNCGLGYFCLFPLGRMIPNSKQYLIYKALIPFNFV